MDFLGLRFLAGPDVVGGGGAEEGGLDVDGEAGEVDEMTMTSGVQSGLGWAGVGSKGNSSRSRSNQS